MNTPLALIVDDEPDIRELLEITLNRMNIRTLCAEDIKTAKQQLTNNSIDICLTDMRLPDGDGLDLVDFIQNSKQPMPVAVISAHGSMDIAIQAMKKGAFDFLSKPIDISVLRELVKNALKMSPPVSLASTNGLLGDSALMQEVRHKITKVARSQAPIYISGESGTGKELVARLIHQQSPRQSGAFIAVNCGAIPHELMESEFFGHKKGSFTGAGSDKKGLFQAADGGTLFLDEIADLPLSLQVKLLRTIQEKKVRSVGASQEEAVNVRLLSATHKDLNKLVEEGEFRLDLYYRINVIELSLPPLRARKSDIPELANYLLARLAADNEQEQPTISSEAIASLKNYHFPGNVRELENILERAMALYEGGIIDVIDLNLVVGVEHPRVKKFNPSDVSLEDYLENIEKDALGKALEENRWNKTATAKALGLSFRSLRYRLKKLGLD